MTPEFGDASISVYVEVLNSVWFYCHSQYHFYSQLLICFFAFQSFLLSLLHLCASPPLHILDSSRHASRPPACVEPAWCSQGAMAWGNRFLTERDTLISHLHHLSIFLWMLTDVWGFFYHCSWNNAQWISFRRVLLLRSVSFPFYILKVEKKNNAHLFVCHNSLHSKTSSSEVSW